MSPQESIELGRLRVLADAVGRFLDDTAPGLDTLADVIRAYDLVTSESNELVI